MPIQGSASPRSAAGDDRAKATAKWGAACASCAAAKAKCIRTNEDPEAKCDRCERLFKDCTGQVHRPRKKRASKPSKTAQLEERLNGLVDLLRATGELPTNARQETASPYNPPSVPSLTTTRESGPSSGPSPRDTRDARDARDSTRDARGDSRDVRRDAASNNPPPTIPSSYNSFAPPSCICRPEAGETVTDAVESDDALLAKFRTSMHPLAPFVVLPPAATAAQLAADRPFLFLAIKTVASVDNYRSMQGLMYQLITHVADYMLLRAERSLDLLQGLLTILSWYHHHCMMHAQLSNLLHLATSLLSDLNLNWAPRIAERTDLMVLHPNPPNPRTNEERRALLGVWYIRSSVAICFQKTEPMRFSPYVRQCLQELEDGHEVETDATVVALVRMQHLAEKIAAFNNRDESAEDLPGFPRAPRTAYQIAFQNELDRLVVAMPPELRRHRLVDSHVCTITLRLYEPPLLDLPLLQKLSTSLTSAASPMLATALDRLYTARSAIMAFFDQFFTVPITVYQWLPIPVYVHLIHGITMLSRWARLIGPLRPTPQANLRGPAVLADEDAPRGLVASATEAARKIRTATTSASTPASTTTAASTSSAASSNSNSTSTSQSSASASALDPAPLNLKDPSHRLVPGQGASTSGAGTSGIAFIPGMDARELQRDPGMLAAIARLRDHLRQQPDLVLDIPAMLATVWDKFEQSNRDMRTTGAAKFGDSVGRGMNVWDLTARKIAIMRFKVGRYLDGAGAMSDGTSEPRSACARQAEFYQQQQQREQQQQQQQQEQQQQQQQYQQHQQQEAQQQYAQMPQQQQLPLHTTGAGMPMPPPLNGLPPDLGSYVMGGGGVGVADMSYGLGNLEGWDNDPLWTSDLLGPGADPGLWAENMDWVATLG